MNRLAPVSEEPINEENSSQNKKAQTWSNWLRNHFPQLFHKKSDLKILLSVLACPLFPVSAIPKLPISQGLDPVAISSVFSAAQYMGEKHISGIDCFVLKLSAEPADLAERSDSTAEMIKHVTLGYFSQKSGLLVYLEDSYLTRVQTPGCRPTYWETSTCTKVEDYRPVEGMMIAHSGQSSVIITRFGDYFRAGHGVTRMEETYTIDDLAFNVPGLSIDTFLPPQEMQKDYPQETLDWRSPLHR